MSLDEWKESLERRNKRLRRDILIGGIGSVIMAIVLAFAIAQILN